MEGKSRKIAKEGGEAKERGDRADGENGGGGRNEEGGSSGGREQRGEGRSREGGGGEGKDKERDAKRTERGTGREEGDHLTKTGRRTPVWREGKWTETSARPCRKPTRTVSGR